MRQHGEIHAASQHLRPSKGKIHSSLQGPYLSDFDHAAAAREGWALVCGNLRSDGLQPVLITAIQTPDGNNFGFQTDDDAWDYVYTEAKLGSQLHWEAIILAERYNRSLRPVIQIIRNKYGVSGNHKDNPNANASERKQPNT